MLSRLLALSVVSLALTGCCKMPGGSSSSSGDGLVPANDHKDPAPTKPGATPAAHSDFGNDGLPTDIPATRSAVPTLAEWNAVPREITVARSSPLGCSTKMVREWLQVSCHGKDNKGGEAISVDNKVGATGDTFLFAKNKVTSVVTPVLRNHHYEATFAWTGQKQLLVVDWPNGAPHPTIKFTDPLEGEGATSFRGACRKNRGSRGRRGRRGSSSRGAPRRRGGARSRS